MMENLGELFQFLLTFSSKQKAKTVTWQMVVRLSIIMLSDPSIVSHWISLYFFFEEELLQWNPVNTVTNGPK